MAEDFAKLAERIAEAARRGVQIERLWLRKLEDEKQQEQVAKGVK